MRLKFPVTPGVWELRVPADPGPTATARTISAVSPAPAISGLFKELLLLVVDDATTGLPAPEDL